MYSRFASRPLACKPIGAALMIIERCASLQDETSKAGVALVLL